MKKYTLLLLLVSAAAHSQTPPVAAPTVAAVPPTAAAPVAAPAPVTSPASTGNNPFARPAANPAPAAPAPDVGAPGTMPPGAMAPGPGTWTPPGVPPGMAPMPGVPSGPTAPGVEQIDEEVSAQRIGKVNGMHIYRGQNTYQFESAKKRIIHRRLTAPLATDPMQQQSLNGATSSANNTAGLPSAVGRPAPR